MDKAPIQVTASYKIKKYDQDGVFLGEESFEESFNVDDIKILTGEGVESNVSR